MFMNEILSESLGFVDGFSKNEPGWKAKRKFFTFPILPQYGKRLSGNTEKVFLINT